MPTTHVLSIAGTRLHLDGAPFLLQGLSFFNALYNPTFNRSDADRLTWLRKFRENGINTLRVWCMWNFLPPHTFIDVAPEHTLYTAEGHIVPTSFARLAALVEAMDSLGMVIEVALFSHEKHPPLTTAAHLRATLELTRRLTPYRNLILQIWNEDSTEVFRCYEAAKSVDPQRLVTNSPGFSSVLGDDAQNRMLDLLTPHTARRESPHFWEVAPRQIAALMEKFNKPVLDDEPARNGPEQFGGVPGGTQPEQHIAQIQRVREVWGYHIYHHDMFQYGYGHPLTPPSGIPDPDFSPFHRQVFDYLRDHPQW